jgi:hypothetical protein
MRRVPRRAAASRWVRREIRGVPLARLLVIAELGLMASRHLRRLDAGQRARLFSLFIRARGRPRSLTPAERIEFLGLLARLEPRVFMGMAFQRLSPVPLPKRLLYGRRGSAPRATLGRGG